MPAFNHIYMDVRNKGIAVVTIDQDRTAENAAQYLARHKYSWTNFHDVGGKLASPFKSEGIPLAILLNKQGKIVYYDFGGDEAAVRKAIAALGTEFASIATPLTPRLAIDIDRRLQ
jgi:hypothetical protein